MSSLALLPLCFALGYLLRLSGRLPLEAHKALNAVVINVALPALVLRHVHGLTLDPALLLPAVMPWVLFGLGVAFFGLVGRFRGWSPHTIGGLMLTGGLANTSFVGLPMIEAFYGPGLLSVGIVADQLGSYFVLGTLGVLAATLLSAAGPVSFGLLLRSVVSFPPFQAMVLAIVLSPVPYPDAVTVLLDRLSAMLTPLALISVGYQLRFSGIRSNLAELSAGLFYKLLLGPALMAVLFATGFKLHGAVLQVSVFEAAMGPHIGAAIVAINHGLNPRLVTLMVGLGIPLSLLTASMWSQLLRGI